MSGCKGVDSIEITVRYLLSEIPGGANEPTKLLSAGSGRILREKQVEPGLGIGVLWTDITLKDQGSVRNEASGVDHDLPGTTSDVLEIVPIRCSTQLTG